MDDDLLKLGDLLRNRIAKFHKSRLATRWTDERLSNELQKFIALENRIIATATDSLAGLKVKARLVRWILDGQLPAPTGESTEERLACSILKDVLRISEAIEFEESCAARPQVEFLDRVG